MIHPSDFQKGVIDELRRRLLRLTHEMTLSDGARYRLKLGKREMADLESHGFLDYLSRWLLFYVKNNREVSRPDLEAAGYEFMRDAIDTAAKGHDVEDSDSDPAEEARAPAFFEGFGEIADLAASKAASLRRLRPRAWGGRISNLPQDQVVRGEFDALVARLEPKRKRGSSLTPRRDRALLASEALDDLRAVIAPSACPTPYPTATEVTGELWPFHVGERGCRPRSSSAVAVALVALAYRVHPRQIQRALRATKPTSRES